MEIKSRENKSNVKFTYEGEENLSSHDDLYRKIPYLPGTSFQGRGVNTIDRNIRIVEHASQIQRAIDELHALGGGVVLLSLPQTYTLTDDITLYSHIYLQGRSSDVTALDFSDNTHGIVVHGTSTYSTGTVAVTHGSTTVTGTSTSWSTNVSPGQYILLSGLWYPITAVSSDTSLTIGISFADTTLSGATYTVATKISDIKVTNLTIKNASTAIDVQYADEYYSDDLEIQACVTAIDVSDSSNVQITAIDVAACNNGYTFSNTHFMKLDANGAVDTAVGDAISFDSCTRSTMTSGFFLNAAGNGMSLTSCSDLQLSGAFSFNGGYGIEFVSGNSNCIIGPGTIKNNTSDGIKLTATSDENIINQNFIENNGAYGINIAASTDDNNLLLGNIFSGNTTAASNDSGTGTVIRSNIGLIDN